MTIIEFLAIRSEITVSSQRSREGMGGGGCLSLKREPRLSYFFGLLRLMVIRELATVRIGSCSSRRDRLPVAWGRAGAGGKGCGQMRRLCERKRYLSSRRFQPDASCFAAEFRLFMQMREKKMSAEADKDRLKTNQKARSFIFAFLLSRRPSCIAFCSSSFLPFELGLTLSLAF